MFQRALIAVDSAAEAPLLACAADLGAWGVTHIVLVHLLKVGYLQGPSYGEADRHREALEREAEALRAAGFTVDVHVGTAGDIGTALATLATETFGADLLVVGSRSQFILDEVFLGSVARKVLRHATVPVLLHWIEPEPGGTAGRCAPSCTDTLRHVLLATDLTAGSVGAQEAALALAARGARVDSLHVAEPPTVDRFPDWAVMGEAALQRLQERIAAAGGRGEVVVEIGEPEPRILEIAGDRDVSLLVIGKRGRSWPAELTMGSAAKRLSREARRPVLMVPRAMA